MHSETSSSTSHVSDWPIADHHMFKKTFRIEMRTSSVCERDFQK